MRGVLSGRALLILTLNCGLLLLNLCWAIQSVLLQLGSAIEVNEFVDAVEVLADRQVHDVGHVVSILQKVGCSRLAIGALFDRQRLLELLLLQFSGLSFDG